MQQILIEDNESLASLIKRQAGSEAVAVDTEFMRRDTFYPHPGLIQLCFSAQPDTAWLVDTVLVDDVQPLRELLADTSVLKVLHSASEDLEVFAHYLSQQPVPLFDTQKAAAFLGRGFGLGYRALVEEISGQVIEKDETRSDWLARPLSASQLNYAAADVVPLLEVYRTLYDGLRDEGKLEWVLEEGAHATANAASSGASFYLRVKSAWQLPRRQLGVLRSLCDWREARARTIDKPRGWILKDPVCLEIARKLPANMSELRQIADLPPAVVRKQGEALLDLVDEALSLPEDALPAPMPRPLDAAQRAELKQLRQRGAEIAQQLGVEPEILLPSKDYELLLRTQQVPEAVDAPRHWGGWRAERVVKPLLAHEGAG